MPILKLEFISGTYSSSFCNYVINYISKNITVWIRTRPRRNRRLSMNQFVPSWLLPTLYHIFWVACTSSFTEVKMPFWSQAGFSCIAKSKSQASKILWFIQNFPKVEKRNGCWVWSFEFWRWKCQQSFSRSRTAIPIRHLWLLIDKYDPAFQMLWCVPGWLWRA